jgi:HD-GYP domain-containing protein (c-di-GMP phosphodiesterase class II)
MIIEQDVYTNSGNLLISKGTQLTNGLILKLLEFGIKQVGIKDIKPENIEYKHFEKDYTESVDKIKDGFKIARYQKTVNLSEFENIIDGLLDNAKSGRGVLSYMKLIEQKDEYTLKHSINVSITAMLMGKWLNYSDQDIKTLGTSAILHDIGKLFIPDSILNKASKLNETEFKIMKNHPMLGYKLLKDSNINNDQILNAVLTHHERFNGEGYPFKLKGYKIGEFARILAICDVYDAVTSDRVYKQKENPLEGLKVIFDDSYNGLDPYLCKVFLNNVTIAYCGSNAVLNDGSVGKIIKIIPEHPTKPWVAVDDSLCDLQRSNNIEIVDII